MNAFCSLRELRQLRLYRISDYFSDDQIVLLAQNLSNLEDLDISGYGVSDLVWPSLAKLPLKVVNFGGITTFTEDGILDFIERLDPVLHRGLELSVTNADPDAAIAQDSLDLVRDVLATKLDGKFDYVLLRGLYPPCPASLISLTVNRSKCLGGRFRGGLRLKYDLIINAEGSPVI